MNDTAAKNLVKNTFENPYTREHFLIFTKNLLKFFNPKTFIYRGKYIPEVYKSHIKTLERFGKYEDEAGNKIDVLTVQLKKTSSIEQARSMQRNFIAWYLRGSRGGVHKDAALVAFYTKDSVDWRFSLIKMEYELARSKKGKLKATTKLTPARRFSFLVGKNEASHTAQKQLLPILLEDQHTPSLKDFEDAFSVEKVTKEFFEKYRELFLQIQESLEELTKQDKKIKKDFDYKKIDTIDFSKKLLGQIVFLYFLQKKGWFGVKRNADWGTGSKQFLRELFDKKHGNYRNFFNDVLEALFYEALRNDRSHDDHYFSQFNCKIPFLNGGLFDPLNEYDWIGTDILLDNKLFSNQKGNGILDVFDRYNFTVKEDEPLEREVAVDPEMLGKVFENLLEVKDRKSKGTYYTPREIVHYMCQESLINYLIAESDLEEKTIRLLVKPKVLSKKEIRKIKSKKKSNHKIIEGTVLTLWEKDAKNLDKILANIKVCDPACGSGAFLVGMLKEIVQARKRLAFILNEKTTTYDFKKQSIEKCIYGVDIDLGAVEIAKLRLWLSLIVDEKDIKNIKPLPNLDYKIMQGNSLIEFISPESLARTTDSKRNQLIDQFNQLKQEYLTTHAPSKKKQKRQEINELTQKIINYDREQEKQSLWRKLLGLKGQQKLFEEKSPQLSLADSEKKKQKLEKRLEKLKKIQQATPADHFGWHLNFNEVFEEKGGFDVVIANPPYVRVQNLSYKEIDEYKKRFKTAHKRIDVSTLFMELANQIMNRSAIATYIASSQFLKTEYGRKIRKFLISKLKRIIFFGDNQVFSDVINYTSIFLFSKSNDNSFFELTNAEKYLGKQSFYSYIENYSEKILKGSLSSDSWNIEHPDKFNLLNKIRSLSDTLLMDIASVDYGLVTGKDKIFVFKKGDKGFLEQSPYILPLLKPSNLSKYHIERPNHFVIYPYKIDSNKTVLIDEKELRSRAPELYHYLLENKKDLVKRKDSRKRVSENGKKWYSLMRHSSFQKANKEKIVTQALCKKNEFCLDQEGNFFTGGSIYSIASKNRKVSNKALLGLLNSNLCEFFYQLTCPIRQHGYKFYAGSFLKQFPISLSFLKRNKKISNCVAKIINISKESGDPSSAERLARIKEYEKQIDQLVYKLYGLTPEEMEIVEKNSK